MTISILAEISLDQSWNPFAQFGVTNVGALLANLIAFIVIAVVLRLFAFKPIHKMLATRRERIVQGEQMRKESEQQLTEIKKTTQDMLTQAGHEGQRHIDEAKQAAARLLEEKEQEASKRAVDIVEKSRESMAIEARKAQEDLKSEFAKLVAVATAKVTGKILSEDDQRRINSELIESLDSKAEG